MGALVGGQRFGGHAIVRHLATGGMAEVYLARAVGPGGFDKLVALKRIQPQFADLDNFVAMFLEEARLAATLQHQNIGQIHTFGREGATYYYTMEYLRGHDVAKVVRLLQRGDATIDLPATVAVGIGAAAGLHHAHEQCDLSGRPLGMVHRDVSPSNILVTYEGGIKVVDFGIAKATSRRATTAAGTIKGKVPYMSPEQCSGDRVDRRSDVYSLGVVLYELATGRRLFPSDDDVATIQRIVAGDVPAPSTLVPDFPPALEQILARAMRVDPGQRYQTALELGLALEELAIAERYATSALSVASWLRGRFGDPEMVMLDEAPRTIDVPASIKSEPIAAPTRTARAPSPAPERRSPSRRRLLAVAGLISAGTAIGVLAARHTSDSSVASVSPSSPAPTSATLRTSATPTTTVASPTTPSTTTAAAPAMPSTPPTTPSTATTPSTTSSPASRGHRPRPERPKRPKAKSDAWTRDSPILPGLE